MRSRWVLVSRRAAVRVMLRRGTARCTQVRGRRERSLTRGGESALPSPRLDEDVGRRTRSAVASAGSLPGGGAGHARSDGLQHQHPRCSLGRVKRTRHSSRGTEAAVHALDKRDHPFERRTVLGIWAALFAHCGIRAQEMAHRFERGSHLRAWLSVVRCGVSKRSPARCTAWRSSPHPPIVLGRRGSDYRIRRPCVFTAGGRLGVYSALSVFQTANIRSSSGGGSGWGAPTAMRPDTRTSSRICRR